MSTFPIVAVLIAAVIDLRTREIPDAIPVALLVGAVLARLCGWSDLSWLDMLAGGVVGFLIPALFAWRGAMGGGDVKLLSGLGFWFGLTPLMRVLFWTALAGGALAVGILVTRALRREPGQDADPSSVGQDEPDEADPELAYGPAIAVGVLAAWFAGQLPGGRFP